MSRLRVTAWILVCAIAGFFFGGAVRAADEGRREKPGLVKPDLTNDHEQARELQCVPEEMCCRVCTKGQARGDSCISRGNSCHKGRGCASDAAEVCE